MNKTLETINDFIKDIYEVEFIKPKLDSKFEDLEDLNEIRKAYETIIDIVNTRRKPSSDELLNLYPLLEVAIQWYMLKTNKKLTDKFLQHCRGQTTRHKEFYGAIFEIDMASRFLFAESNPQKIDIDFPEDRIKKKNIKIIDIIINKSLGIECKSKRYADAADIPKFIEKINQDIEDKSEKFKPENLHELGVNLETKAIVFDITRNEYQKPKFLRELKNLKVPAEIDGIVFTWKETMKYEGHDIIRIKYNVVGNPQISLPAFQFEYSFKTGNYFFRKYVEPEPQWAQPGQEESCIERVLAEQGGKLVKSELLRLTKMNTDEFEDMLKRLKHEGKIKISDNRITLIR